MNIMLLKTFFEPATMCKESSAARYAEDRSQTTLRWAGDAQSPSATLITVQSRQRIVDRKFVEIPPPVLAAKGTVRKFIRQTTWTVSFCLAALTARSEAQTLSTVGSLTQSQGNPISLLAGSDGNFYGISGNFPAESTIFEMTPAGAATALYTFSTAVNLNSLIQAQGGSFYGTSSNGGTAGCTLNRAGCGFIFTLTSGGTLTTLYNFSGASDGASPNVLVQGSDGNFYGTTAQGGGGNCQNELDVVVGCGTFFQLTAAGSLNTLYSFQNGTNAPSILILGSDGNFYGTSASIFFKITPGGAVTELTSYSATDGTPIALIQGADGNFYGLTQNGGPHNCTFVGESVGCGTLFKIMPGSTATTFTTVYAFGPDAIMFAPQPAVLIQATDGNLYGLVEDPNSSGALVFKATLGGSYTVAYSFGQSISPPNFLIQGSDGNFYGTTELGGANSVGLVFKLSLGLSILPKIAATGGVLNGASFQAGIGANSWFTINGTNLSTKTDTWDNSITNGTLPTKLGGVSVMVGTEPAYVEYVSATQINALAPNVAAGSAPVTVTTSAGTSQAVMTQVQAEQPAFFQWGTYAVATRQDFSLAVKNGTFPGTTTVPAKPGDVIILWGTGFGPTSPAAPAGVETPSDATYNAANMVTVTVGGMPATVYGAALAPGYAGLYQVAIQIPALSNGDYSVVATVSDAQSPSATMITVQQ
jgi:uncharacterized protein (TIGR03437 family)